MRRLFLLVFMTIFTIIFSANSSLAASIVKDVTFKSEVIKSIPKTGWTSNESLEVGEALLNLKDISIINDELKIVGLLEYDGKVIEINQVGKMKIGEFKENDLVIDFEDKNTDNSMKVIHANIIQNAESYQVDEQKDLIGSDIIKLVFLDKEARDFILFEEKLESVKPIINTDISTLSKDSLDISESESWYHKVVEPKITSFVMREGEENIPEDVKEYLEYLESQGELEIKAKEKLPSSSDGISLQQQRYENSETIFGILRYETASGVTTHYMRTFVYAFFHYPGRNATLNTGVDVENKSMQLPDGSWVNGRSNLQAGRGSNPVATRVTTFPNNSLEAPYLTEVMWGGDSYSGSISGSFSVGINYGILSGSISGNFPITEDVSKGTQFRNIYRPNNNNTYPRETRIPMSNTALTAVNHNYNVNWRVVTPSPLNSQRAVRVRYYIPFYDQLDWGSTGFVHHEESNLFIYYRAEG